MPDDITRWLTEYARPLGTLTPGAPHQDLEPLGEALRDVRIVGLGESTHGTHEFFRLKHRIVEFLVREAGFTTLAMEASASAARALDTYVRHGTGDPARLITRLGFWTWRTEEMLDLVEWLRAHNRGVPESRQVRFVGTDPQRCTDSLEAVAAFLRQVAPERAQDVDGLQMLKQAHPASRPDPEQALLRRVEALAGFLEDRREQFARHTTADAAREAVEHARILTRAADLVTRSPDLRSGEHSVLAARDRYMADAVARLVDDSPSTRVILWAHNGHLTAGTYGDGVPSLGSGLRERYGNGYYALALLFGKGSFLARRGHDLQGPPRRHRIGTGIRSIEARLAHAVPGNYYADLRTAGLSPEAARWLRAPHTHRSFGAGVPRFVYRFHTAPLVPAEDYDGIAFVAHATCSRLLPAAQA
ncbi:erythromycin esterase [Streptomyces sp. 2224.1]|uniref:erythromycin esterase family protein n=1 Tax=unclassified Streptomyces TaxID=2593676 RepID=UPI000888AE76|nr:MULTISPECIES: erythromycin esterase family protein [unclassified Streptomyces]PBC86621.1 erythromycin esterase [Streptomyces sp. 2321.6]SDQ78048.1 erythromycin esterase [Streptomyces sp. KS_16]SED86695.1 erythromycin esterase [Streptomyces sp. 2224.1]SEE04199.1 erythromycin esterase [Streptomyces sp. 2133.1]SNC73730.1 erythromycin esterase [Streptomyces sp. 2114.4]